MLLTCISTDKTSFVSRFLFNTVSTFLFVYMVQIGLQYGSNWVAIWPKLSCNMAHIRRQFAALDVQRFLYERSES